MHKDYSSLMDYALRILSKKRYTVHEMKKKLSGFLKRREEAEQTEMSDDVINRLVELRYLDDKEYAKSYVSDRVRFRPRGKMMIGQELKLKGINKSDLDEAFVDVNGESFDEVKAAEDVLKKKERAWENVELKKKKEKAFRLLSSKGFGRDTIYKVVRSCYSSIRE